MVCLFATISVLIVHFRDLSELDKDGKLNKVGFRIAIHLVYFALKNPTLPIPDSIQHIINSAKGLQQQQQQTQPLTSSASFTQQPLSAQSSFTAPQQSFPYPQQSLPQQQLFPQQSFPQQSLPQQSLPQQSFPQQSYPQQSFTQQQSFQQSFPQQQSFQQSFPQQQTFPQTSFNQQSFGQQAYPQQNMQFPQTQTNGFSSTPATAQNRAATTTTTSSFNDAFGAPMFPSDGFVPAASQHNFDQSKLVQQYTLPGASFEQRVNFNNELNSAIAKKKNMKPQ
jgi:hypothetical protein